MLKTGGPALCLKSGDSKAIAGLIVKMYKDVNLCVTMGQLAKEKLIKEMSLEVCCKTITKFYRCQKIEE